MMRVLLSFTQLLHVERPLKQLIFCSVGGANPKIANGHGKIPLQAALEANECNIAAVASLINDGRSKLHATNKFAKTILHLAAERGYSDIVKLLLDKKVDPDKRDNEGKTPLFLAVERQDERTTKELAQKKARDWGSDIVGRSTIYFAAKYDMNRDFFKIIGAQENDIQKQILVACELGDLAAYNNLTQWVGEDPNIPELGVSATNFIHRLFALVSYSSYKQERTKIAALLLTRQKGFHIKHLNFAELDRNNNTVLTLACKNGLDLIVSLILMVGSQLCCRSSLLTVGTPTPLWQAANTGHAETLAVLIPYVHETELGQHVAPDGTSPLIRAVMKNNVATMRQIMKKYNTVEVMGAMARYGSAELFDALNLKMAMSKAMLLVAVEAENYGMIKKIIEVARIEKDPELASRVEEINQMMLRIEKETERPITSVAIRELFALSKWPQNLPKQTFLVEELSKQFPKFNPEIEERPFPLIYRNEVSMTEVKEKALVRFCPLVIKEKNEMVREVSEVPLSQCFDGCKQQKECAKIKALVKCMQLLEEAMIMDEILGQLGPAFAITGSTVENTRFCHASEIDISVSFSTLAKSPFRLDCDSSGNIRDAMKVFSPVGIKHFDIFTLNSEPSAVKDNNNEQMHITSGKIFDFPKFLYYFLNFIKTSLLELSSTSDWPEQLYIQDTWSPDNKCCIQEREFSPCEHSKSVYNPHTHCDKCRPAVTHTKIGATPIFTWKDDDNESVLTVDLIPVFPVESPKGFLPLFNAIVSTLAKEAPEGGNKHFKSIMEKDRILPESFQNLLEKQHKNRFRKTYDVAMKLLNYGPESNYIIRPGQITDDRQAKSKIYHPQMKIEQIVNEVYLTIKGLKSILCVNVDSYFIKKVIRLEEVTRMILDQDVAKVGLPRKVFDVLDLPELRGYFEEVIDYKGWQEKLEGKVFCEDEKDKIPVKLNGLSKLKMEQRLQIEEYERHGFFV